MVPLGGFITAPGVSSNCGDRLRTLVPDFTINVTLSLVMIGSRVSSTPGREAAVMSHSAFSGSLLIHEFKERAIIKNVAHLNDAIAFCIEFGGQSYRFNLIKRRVCWI